MLRKLIVAMAATGAISAGPALGLGLGEITINSYLNQPLDAEIELVQVRELSNTEILPNLATRDDFKRAGVERPFFLSDLKFETVVHDDGRTTVRLTSRKPVVEPFLNFLVEVHWPSGRLLREYTLLLDPPSFSASVAEEVARKPMYQGGSANRYQRIPDAVAPIRSTPDSSRSPSRTPTGSHKVKKDETLWDIALRFRPDRSVSPQQMMLAIQAENPGAFINGNINMLKQGSVLRIPDRVMLRDFSEAGSIAGVAKQNSSWKGSVRQLDATRRSSVDDEPGKRQDDGRLTVVSSGDGGRGNGADQGGGSGDSARVRALEDELALSSERIDLLTRENAELRDKLDALTEQLGTLEKLIALKNDELTVIQGMGQQDAGETLTPPEPPRDIAQADPPTTLPPPANGEIDYNYQNDAESGETQQPMADAGKRQGQQNPSDNKPSEKPDKIANDTKAKPEKSFIDEFLDSPLYMGIAGGGVLFIVAGLMFVARRRAQAEDVFQDSLNDQEAFSPAGNEQIDLGTGLSPAVASTKAAGGAGIQPLELDADLEIDQDLLDQQVASTAAGSVMAEADVYADYGRFQQAAEILTKAVETEPGNASYRLKLMEVQAGMDDLDGFREQLNALGDVDEATQAKVEALKSQFANTTLADFEPEDVLNELEALTDELTSTDIDLDASLDSVVEEASSDLASADALDLALEDDLSIDDSVDVETSLDTGKLEDDDLSIDGLDDLELDLGLEDASSDAVSEGGSDEMADLDDISLSLDDDEAVSEVSELTDDLSLGDTDDIATLDMSDAEDLDDIALDLELDDAEDSESSAPEALPDAESLDDLSLDLDADEFQLDASVEETPSLVEDEGIVELEDLELNDELETAETEASQDEQSDDESFDLGDLDLELNDDLGESLEASSSEGNAVSDEIELELDESEFDLDAEMASLDTDLSDLSEGLGEADLDGALQPEAVESSEDTDLESLDLDSMDLSEPLSEMGSSGEVGVSEEATELDEDLEFLEETDETATKLDLARAYIEMGDQDGARDILEEVAREGDDAQKQEADSLLKKL
ncbi:FimV/HubP family polar landmark protein [Kistimonas asteriae]|uniref:FimV/HubP family polar landmark protein n=1 Tax=Kistimonas asteriae TaxID=517724 RepID=UPI001BACA23C|nr:FimV/HubP family polar landmark protein [Kistimonas asteriae]